ncbi:discoidin domain-containing protein [Paenibacillus sp. HW567]|uniref:discoidin domain-containing protein n=1 Tax=Paenibacillus sp. HW567 TaxID=1034769 RepID=UPI00036566CB|nr:discoidin domain-containing protein [Paenibacillus sp. HW567]
MNYRYSIVTLLFLMLTFLNKPALATAEAATVESLNNSKTYYQYDLGGTKLIYTLTPYNTVYNVYDANGNMLRTIQSDMPALFTSSTFTGWEAYKLGDGNAESIWSSHGHPVEQGTEWVAADLGDVHFIGGISLTPRSTMGFPKDFRLQSSTDAINWTDIPGQTYTNYSNNGSIQNFTFNNSIAARYVRVFATKLGKDDMGNYYFQLGEFNVHLSKITASSSLPGWPASRLIDGNNASYWSSNARGNEASIEWIAADAGDTTFISGISLTPRGTLSFPKDFKLQYSLDAVNWTDIPGQVYTNYANNGKVQTFSFDRSVIARYVRIYATKLSKDDMGNYYFQLGEFTLNSSKVAASSSLPGWSVARLTDNDTTSIWSSNPHGTATESEWVAFHLGRVETVGSVTITPRAKYAFPVDFKFQASNDAVNWTDIKGQSYTNYINNGNVQTFTFESSVIAKYIRLYATKLSKDDVGNYYFQLAELKTNLVNAAASASLTGWPATRLIDNNTNSIWSSPYHASSIATEWAALDLVSSQSVKSVTVTPRGILSFPLDFKLQYSNDGIRWQDIPGQSYTNFSNNGSVRTFTFTQPILARFIRLYATRLGVDDRGNNYFQLVEMKVNLAS